VALFIIRYGELGLKSQAVRRRFEDALRKNIAIMFIRKKKECRIELDRGRVYLWSDAVEDAMEILRRTFGIVSFSQAIECSSDREEICRKAAKVSEKFFIKGMSFRVKARRTGQHEYTSMELAKDAGSAIWMANEALEPKVDLTHPDLTIHVEVRHKRAHIFTEIIPGPGGMPLSTQGKVLGIINDEKGMVACWLMMKRGCRVVVSTDDECLIEALRLWDSRLEVIGPVKILDGEESATAIKAEGIVLGWGLTEFAENKCQASKFTLPVFYPLFGINISKVGDLVQQIKT
jgi:thiamine biosynthesis protein ThiI